jgi:hypothetical protein
MNPRFILRQQSPNTTTPKLTKKEMKDAVAEGVYHAFLKMLMTAPTDLYRAMEKGMAAAGGSEVPVPAASHVTFYVCASHRIHVELFDEHDQPIATFAVPDGFADALRQAEADAKESPDVSSSPLQ